MFEKTSLRLSALYLLILMVISLFFSVTLYTVSAHQIDRGFKRQDALIEGQIGRLFVQSPAFQERFLQSRQSAATDAKNSVLGSLVLINSLILIAGGALSYILARRSLQPIEKAHKSLEQFTADASHELRTPIAAMKSEIEVALMQPKLQAKDAKTVLKSNLEELETLTELTNGLLRIARLEENSYELSVQRIKPIIEQAIKRTAQKATVAKVKITHSATKKNIQVKANSASLVESLVTVLDNAVKYSKANTTVHIEVSQESNQTTITITDNGIGIPTADLPHVFERFYRADVARSKQGTGGHGLGLSIARQLVQHQKGKITISSELNKSTTVTITLPSS